MIPAHPLDRPVWSALTSRQTKISQGNSRALRFAPHFGPFGAPADTALESLIALAALVPAESSLVLMEAEEIPAPPGTSVMQRAVCHQMTAERLTPGEPAFLLEPLTEADGPEMLALATLTRPGPFAARTHQLGDFVGVKHEGRLVAMAGERMQPTGFTEVSGVCTHPDHRGHGYAGGLIRVVASRILARGETPFLHVYATNTGAIALYESLGFAFRRAVTVTVLAQGNALSATV